MNKMILVLCCLTFLFSFDKTCGDVDCVNTIFVESIVDNGDGNISLTLSYDFEDEVAGFQFDILSDGSISFNPNTMEFSNGLSDWSNSTMNSSGTVLGFDTQLSTLVGDGELLTVQGTYDTSLIGESIVIDASENCGNGNGISSSLICRKDNGDTRMVLSNAQAEPVALSHFQEAVWLVGTSSDASNHLDNEEIKAYSYKLNSNYPNPFNPATHITYSIEKGGSVDISVYDIQGRKIRTLVSGYVNPGKYQATWDSLNESGLSVAAGIYVYRITSKDFSSSKKMLLLK